MRYKCRTCAKNPPAGRHAVRLSGTKFTLRLAAVRITGGNMTPRFVVIEAVRRRGVCCSVHISFTVIVAEGFGTSRKAEMIEECNLWRYGG